MNTYKRVRRSYDPAAVEPYPMSRSKIDLFIECPRCFYLDRRFGISRPGIPKFTLNMAVDTLLKKEFDLLRKNGEAHALMKKYDIDALPLKHADLSVWRDDVRNYVGISTLHEPTNFKVSGIVDDVWQDKKGNFLIVDYKATSTEREISLEDRWKQGYKRQMEVYQWLFKKNDFPVSPVGYFVFANAGKNRPTFDGRLEFELSIIPHRGDDSWVEPTLLKIKQALNADELPAQSPTCEHCEFRMKASELNI